MTLLEVVSPCVTEETSSQKGCSSGWGGSQHRCGFGRPPVTLSLIDGSKSWKILVLEKHICTYPQNLQRPSYLSQDLWHLTHPVYNLYIYCCGHTFSIIQFQTGLHMKPYAYPRIIFGSRKTDIRFFLVKRKTLCLCCFSSLCPLSINIYLVILLLCLGTSV